MILERVEKGDTKEHSTRLIQLGSHLFNCVLFHKLAKNASIIEKGLECVRCSACKRLVERLKTAVSSPDNIQRERAKDRSRLQKYSHTELTLDDEQHNELSQLMDAIEEKRSKEIEEIMQDAVSHGVGDSVREIWEIDKQRMKDEFSQDQKKNCKCITWCD